MIQDVLFYSFLFFFIKNIWFNTNAFVEYCSILFLDKIFKIDEYLEFTVSNNAPLHYTNFLKIQYDNFPVRLITCPICLNTWIGLIALYFHENLFIFFSASFFSLMSFYHFSNLLVKVNNND